MNELSERLFSFSTSVLKQTKDFPDIIEYNVIRNQLVKSATSVSANYEEAQAATSKADFHNKIKIALREARESHYWLRQLIELEKDDDEFNNNPIKDDNKENKSKLNPLAKEADELKRILATIALKTKK